MVTITPRQHGARASAAATGLPKILSRSGAPVAAATAPSAVGYSPLDLLHAALASCLVISAQMAARELGLSGAVTRIDVEVTGEKAGDPPSRLQTFHVAFEIAGAIGAEDRRRLIERAEQLCTVSNTLRTMPAIRVEERQVKAE